MRHVRWARRALFARPFCLVARASCGRTGLGSRVVLAQLLSIQGDRAIQYGHSLPRRGRLPESLAICTVNPRLQEDCAIPRMRLPGPRKTPPRSPKTGPRRDRTQRSWRPTQDAKRPKCRPHRRKRAPQGQDAAKLEWNPPRPTQNAKRTKCRPPSPKTGPRGAESGSEAGARRRRRARRRRAQRVKDEGPGTLGIP